MVTEYNPQASYPMPPAQQPKRNSGFPLAVITLGILVLAFNIFFMGVAEVNDTLIMAAMITTFISPVFSAIDMYRRKYVTFSVVMFALSLIPAAFVALLWIAGAALIASM
jgi:hypothetical protein